MDQVVVNALKKLRELQLETRNLELFIATYEQLSGTKIKRDELLSIPNSPEQNKNTDGTQPAPPKRRQSPNQIAEIAERIIREMNRPMARGELVAELEKRDVVLASGDKAKYLGTILWRHKHIFRNIDGEGYWVGDNPWAGAESLFTKESN